MAIPLIAAFLITLRAINPQAEIPTDSSYKTHEIKAKREIPSKPHQNRPQKPLRTRLKQNR